MPNLQVMPELKCRPGVISFGYQGTAVKCFEVQARLIVRDENGVRAPYDSIRANVSLSA